MDSSSIRHLVQTTTDNVERVIIGKRREVELVMVALLCKGHVLIEDVPGTGKTLAVAVLYRSGSAAASAVSSRINALRSEQEKIFYAVTRSSLEANQHGTSIMHGPGGLDRYLPTHPVRLL